MKNENQGDQEVILHADMSGGLRHAAMMMMAVMLVQIEKKMDSIQKTADSIMSFLEMDKQAEQQGNINILNDSVKQYLFIFLYFTIVLLTC